MKTRNATIIFFILFLSTTGTATANAEHPQCHKEDVSTHAGHIDFSSFSHKKNAIAHQQIHHLNVENGIVELQDGSRWKVSRVDVIKGWEKCKNLVITQNHSTYSTSSYALVNLDIQLAEPISLVREPTPKHSRSVSNVVLVNDLVTLNDGKKWIVHSSDRGKLNKIIENDRIVIGVNTSSDRDTSPYLLIDTSTHLFVRAQMVE